MSRPGARRFQRDDVRGDCAVLDCDQPLDARGARCTFHRVNGDEFPYRAPRKAQRRPAEHGEVLRYRRDGCHCTACRAANAAEAAKHKATRLARAS
jgi:hypothetical protein